MVGVQLLGWNQGCITFWGAAMDMPKYPADVAKGRAVHAHKNAFGPNVEC